MTQQEKIIAYDKAIKVAENIHKFSSDIAEVKRMEQIFPELKVSKDEEIRKEIIEQINLLKSATLSDLKVNQFNSWIDWLEKQGEHAIFFNKIQIGDKVTRNRDGVLVNLSQLNRVAKPAERQGENSMGISEATKQKLEDNLNKALEKETPESWNKFLDGGEQKSTDKVEPKFKVGDIVKHKDNPYLTYILKRFTDDGDYEFHAIGKDGHEGCTCFSVVKYQDEWELVEQKPVCSEEQHEKESLSDIENRIINFAMQFHDNRMKPEAEWEDELKMLRDNIKIDHWSEEDEVKINRIVACLENLNVADNDILLKDVDWLKSLKPQNQWKPSNEQMLAIDTAINVLGKGTLNGKQLIELQEQLEKLK